MASIIYPSDFFKKKELLSAINAKHKALGANSPITGYLAKNKIDLDADELIANQAYTEEKNRISYAGIASVANKEAELLMKPVNKHLKENYQTLKDFNKPNYKELVSWGANITDGGKITYESDIEEQFIQFDTFKKTSDGFLPADNPLTPFYTKKKIVLADDEKLVIKARASHKKAVANKGLSETATTNRDNLFDPLMVHIMGIGQILVDYYSDNPKELVAWGYTIDLSSGELAEQQTNLLPNETKTVSGCVIGEKGRNEGPADVLLTFGKSKNPNTLLVKKGDEFTIPKGGSYIKVTSLSTTDKAKVIIPVKRK